MSGLFVTGTDTDCGKTQVARVVARALRAAGTEVRVLKPVETGCEVVAGERVPADALALAEAAQDDAPLDQVCPYRLLLPAAPEIAARREDLHIEVERIEAAYRRAEADSDLVLVEGAGGLLVPLTPALDMAGLAAQLGLPLLVVARASLGTLNHTLLTLEAARTRSLRVLGLVVSHTHAQLSDADRRNLDLLLERLPVPLLGELFHEAGDLIPPLDAKALLGGVAGS